jgi:hypothetical protein
VVASSCACLLTVLLLECRRVSGQAGSLVLVVVAVVVVVVVVVAWRLPLYVVPASTAAMTIADVVTGDFGQLRQLAAWTRQVQLCSSVQIYILPDSEGAFSPPAISSRLEMEGSEGFFSSAGGEGGDCGCARWYGWSRCRCCACRVYETEGALGAV